MIRRVLFFAGLTLVFTSCHSILFNEDEGKREILLSNFKAIQIHGIYNIVLIQDSTDKLTITGKNNIASVDASVRNDTLVISNSKKWSFNPEKNTLAIHFTSLEKLVTHDAVKVSCEGILKTGDFIFDALGEIADVSLTLDCNYLQLVNSANTLGNFHIKGKAENCYFFNRYGCRIFADSLRCLSAAVINESIGDVRLNASENITAYIHGPGNICYYGEPVIDIAEKRGNGKMIRLADF